MNAYNRNAHGDLINIGSGGLYTNIIDMRKIKDQFRWAAKLMNMNFYTQESRTIWFAGTMNHRMQGTKHD